MEWTSQNSPPRSRTSIKTKIILSLVLERNEMTFFLNSRLENVISLRVKSVAWKNRPVGLANATMLYLSNDQLLQYSSAQSQILTPGLAIGNPLVNRKSLIGSWVIAPGTSNVPNPGYNDAQSQIDLACQTSTDKLTFTLEDDGGVGNSLQRTTISSSDHVVIVLELEQVL